MTIRRVRRFYECFLNWLAVPIKLSWLHFQELIKISCKEERIFYLIESIKANWSWGELNRQINSKLYDKYLISTDKEKIIKLSQNGIIKKQPEDLLKTLYMFEFVGLKENKNCLKTNLKIGKLTH